MTNKELCKGLRAWGKHRAKRKEEIPGTAMIEEDLDRIVEGIWKIGAGHRA